MEHACMARGAPVRIMHECRDNEARGGRERDASVHVRMRVLMRVRVLMLTHMRGKVADMARVYQLAEAHGLTVVEDCAHALGIQWEGVQLGRSARVACFSSQSAKVINSAFAASRLICHWSVIAAALRLVARLEAR